jgi:ribosomal protein L16 Arg81 hydroxylase
MKLHELNLAGLLSPIGADTFGRDYWEKQPLFIQRDAPDYYAELLTLDDIDRFLSFSSLHDSEVQVIINGRKAAPDVLAADRPGGRGQALEVLYDHYRKGATITVQFLHQQWAPLAGLCRSMSAELSTTVQTNAYLTPPGEQGFNPHYDTHDVFVAQVHGTKHWRLYESQFELPLDTQRFSMPEGGLGEPTRELEICAGDLLYLPRGIVHAATSGDAASLHLTIGATHPTWSQILHAVVDQASAVDRRYREALPIGFASDSDAVRKSEHQLAELIADLAHIARTESPVSKVARAAQAGNRPELRGHIIDLEEIRTLDLDTPVHRRAGLRWTITQDQAGISLEFHGKAIKLPAGIAAQLEFAAAGAEFTGRELPGSLDESGRLTLITALAREGFLSLGHVPDEVTPVSPGPRLPPTTRQPGGGR